MPDATYQPIRYETPAERIACIVRTRAETADAQDYGLLPKLNRAFDRAAQERAIRVIILAADGKHFSSGLGPRFTPAGGPRRARSPGRASRRETRT